MFAAGLWEMCVPVPYGRTLSMRCIRASFTPGATGVWSAAAVVLYSQRYITVLVRRCVDIRGEGDTDQTPTYHLFLAVRCAIGFGEVARTGLHAHPYIIRISVYPCIPMEMSKLPPLSQKAKYLTGLGVSGPHYRQAGRRAEIENNQSWPGPVASLLHPNVPLKIPYRSPLTNGQIHDGARCEVTSPQARAEIEKNQSWLAQTCCISPSLHPTSSSKGVGTAHSGPNT